MDRHQLNAAYCIKCIWIIISLFSYLVDSWSFHMYHNFMLTGPKAHIAMADSVAAGALTGVKECKYQFKWDRWNCPEHTLFKRNGPRANKEHSFVHAISSAGVMYIITRNCSQGDFDNCNCDVSRDGKFTFQENGVKWKWGGCSDNVIFGEQISEQFLDALETTKDSRATVIRHNNAVGRSAVYKTLIMRCKCQGVSGACTMKTCWRQLSEFRKVGEYLKKRYKRSIKVEFFEGELSNGARTVPKIVPSNDISRADLVYLDKSPDYCTFNDTLGNRGTEGRECRRPKKGDNPFDKHAKGSCRRLCSACNLAVEKKPVEISERCNCKFHWCCEVKCDQCVENVEKLTCVRKEKKVRKEPES
ncbi:unnamed protein product [Owenia fusiformis]|uniref:Protein Wnt n=1 Tax=Owenia fusiformis TaxID=6347 RepID=A0A8J1U603_OWEFU|nr:unnamed protein product [Owenia fusiformis]